MTARYWLEGVVRRYRESRTRRYVEAVRVPRLDVAPGELLAVVGPNGSGKSTLLETMAFLQPPDEGRILLDGCDVWAQRRQLQARRRCPMLLQRSVLFRTTVLRNVLYPLRTRGVGRGEARRRAEAALKMARLEALAHRGYRELSGGERQRVALARILALEPEILLLDEPAAHVDRANAAVIEEVVRDLHRRTGTTVILASHDSRQANLMADRTVTLVEGRLVTAAADNLLDGRLCREGGLLVFRGESGLVLRFAPEDLQSDNGDRPLPSDAEVQIAICPDRLHVDPAGSEDAEAPDSPSGRIESIRQQRDLCRLSVGLDTGGKMFADVSQEEYDRSGLNLRAKVRLRLKDKAVHLIRYS